MSTTTIVLIGFAIFAVVMLVFAIYEIKHAYEVNLMMKLSLIDRELIIIIH